MLNVKKLSSGYNSPILSSLSFDLVKGDILFLVGANGSGKSTLLKNLSGNLKPLSGFIETFENQKPILISSQIEVQSGLRGSDIFDLFDVCASPWFDKKWIVQFKIDALLNKPFENLSAGEKQRILLVAGLSYKTNLVLFDEPLIFLDWNFYFIFQKALAEQISLGRTFVIANHDLNFSLYFKKSKTLVLVPPGDSFVDLTEKVLNDKRLETLFNIRTEIIDKSGTKTLLLEPIS